MTLDEVIQHSEITAKSNEKLAEFYHKDPGKNQKSGDACQECAAKYRQFAEWLKELKQYREGTLPANDWIPVSERLPEEDNQYLVCFNGGELELDYYCRGSFSYSGVIAWMPLPKPYEPLESEEKK